ncbi:hypothetical protein C442_20441 [Haloarcula amylolytica JCM 13557]|uniref:Uncharacterized protein n=2 Tax=Haloarcula amylolytica TaxID=396317 RepID=M0JYS1_9EURY|nr:hypothetical protein C442_20441 [Haloarcula amylolytica JCM 13557]
MIECTDISKDEREQTAEDFGEDMQDFADDAADVTVEVGQEAADEIDDLLDEGADEIDDIIDKGEGILLGEQDTVIKFPHHSTYVTRWFQKIH